MKRVLVITTCFPPTRATGIHRGLALVRHLAAGGVEVMVLTMPPAPDTDRDAGLLNNVPPSVRVLRTPMPDVTRAINRWLGRRGAGVPPALGGEAGLTSHSNQANGTHNAGKMPATRCGGLVDWCSAWLQFPDSRVGWCVRSLLAHRGAALRFRPDVIYSSAPMWSSHLLAMAMRRSAGCPWVADCRDPWRANPFRRFAHRSHEWADTKLEGRMVRHAAAVICNTPGVRRDFASRYPRWADKFIAIPNGGDVAHMDVFWWFYGLAFAYHGVVSRASRPRVCGGASPPRRSTSVPPMQRGLGRSALKSA